LLGAKQKTLRPAGDVHRAALMDHAVALGRERAFERQVRIEALAVLFEVDDAQAVGALDRAGVGRELADDDAQQRRLAGAVRPEDAEAGAGGEEDIEVREQRGLRQAARGPEALRLSL